MADYTRFLIFPEDLSPALGKDLIQPLTTFFKMWR